MTFLMKRDIIIKSISTDAIRSDKAIDWARARYLFNSVEATARPYNPLTRTPPLNPDIK